MTKLVVFDLDGTIAVNSEFYRTIYSGTLNKLVADRRGEDGLTMLRHCRNKYDGLGELALLALNIPFWEWAQLLVNAPLESLVPQPQLCGQIRDLQMIKVIYTGSPVGMAMKILERIGLSPAQDFDLIIGWKEPELFPTKWTCSPLVFEKILQKFSVSPDEAWAVGDTWITDLLPAQALGMRTALVRKNGGVPDARFSSVEMFIASIKQGGAQ